MRKEWNKGEWTQGRYNAFVTSALRAAARRWPPKYKVLGYALQGRYVNAKTGKQANHYLCACCTEIYPLKEVQVDHKDPVIGKEGFVSWDVYIDRLFCEEKNLQVLCKSCHLEKSNLERKARADRKTTNRS